MQARAQLEAAVRCRGARELEESLKLMRTRGLDCDDALVDQAARLLEELR